MWISKKCLWKCKCIIKTFQNKFLNNYKLFVIIFFSCIVFSSYHLLTMPSVNFIGILKILLCCVQNKSDRSMYNSIYFRSENFKYNYWLLQMFIFHLFIALFYFLAFKFSQKSKVLSKHILAGAYSSFVFLHFGNKQKAVRYILLNNWIFFFFVWS